MILETRDGYKFIIDDEDYELVSKYNWRYFKGYIIDSTTEKNKIIKLHRLLMNTNDSNIFVDHIDMNPLNNMKSNLRLATRAQNAMNRNKFSGNMTSKYKGVRYLKPNGYYQVRITVNKKTITIGHFSNEIAGANAYNYYAKIYHGEYARLNDVEFMDKDTWEKYLISRKEVV